MQRNYKKLALIRVPRNTETTVILTTERNNVVSRRSIEESRILARGRRTSYLGAFTVSTRPVYDEIRRYFVGWEQEVLSSLGA